MFTKLVKKCFDSSEMFDGRHNNQDNDTKHKDNQNDVINCYTQQDIFTAECCYAVYHKVMCHHGHNCCAECHWAIHHRAECYWAECRGAL